MDVNEGLMYLSLSQAIYFIHESETNLKIKQFKQLNSESLEHKANLDAFGRKHLVLALFIFPQF